MTLGNKSLDQDIGMRLQSARDNANCSQAGLARALGVSQSRLAAFETGRNPIRCDIGLRICRSLIINEEWFATGGIPILESAMRARKFDSETIKSPDVQRYLRGMCVDLGAEKEAQEVPISMRFCEAFRSNLISSYKRLAPNHIYMPRLVLRNDDSNDIMANYVRRMNLMNLEMLDNFSKNKGKEGNLAARAFTRAMVEFGMLLFKRFSGFPTPEISESRFNFLRALVSDPSLPIGPLFSAEDGFAVKQKKRKKRPGAQ